MKSIHFIGIKGVGMTPLAIIAHEAGFAVSGCDVADEYITDELLHTSGIPVAVGFDPEHIKNCDTVITTGAHGGYDNVEVKEAKKLGIPVYTQGEAVGVFMKGEFLGRQQKGISVTGCHGKTTTTAMIATVLKAAGLDPSWVIGTGMVPSLGSSGHFGNGEYFVAEADEYATEPKHDHTPKFLWQHPQFGVITNIEFDHPDLYPSLDDVRKAYEKFAGQVATDKGTLVVNGDDPEVKKLLKNYSGKVVRFSLESENDYCLIPLAGGHFVLREQKTQKENTFSISLPGIHNMKNASVAIIIGMLLEIPQDVIQKGLDMFSGTKRRLEYKGMSLSGMIIYDDYAHHPTEIATTIQSLKEKYPDKKIHIIFQPHTFSRTKLLFEQFIDSLALANSVTMIEIYPSAREPFDPSISSNMIAEKLQEQIHSANYLKNANDMVQYIKENKHKFGSDVILVTMGAGDIYQIDDALLQL